MIKVEPVSIPVPYPNRSGRGGLRFIEGPVEVPLTPYFARRLVRGELKLVEEKPPKAVVKPKKPKADKEDKK